MNTAKTTNKKRIVLWVSVAVTLSTVVVVMVFQSMKLRPGDTIVIEGSSTLWREQADIDKNVRLLRAIPNDEAVNGPHWQAVSDHSNSNEGLIYSGSELRILEVDQEKPRALVKVTLDAKPEYMHRLFGVQGKTGWIDMTNLKYNRR